MPPLDTVQQEGVVCCRCGKKFSRHKGFFPVCYGKLYRGLGYVPWCKECIEIEFAIYMDACNDQKLAVRQMCRKLDLYYSDTIYNQIGELSTQRTVMTNYFVKLNQIKFAGKSYDDTLANEGTLWGSDIIKKDVEDDEPTQDINEVAVDPPHRDVVDFWGPGYTNEEYHELEQRMQYWKAHPSMSGVQMDMGTEALLRQIVMGEIDINRARADGKPVDKMVNSLNTLLGSAMLKPVQKKEDVDDSVSKTPLGVWIKRWEDERPLPDIDPEMKDVDNIIKYVTTWFFGHTAKMLGLKNVYSKLYDEEIARLRVDRPEFEEDDDEELLYDIFGKSDDR